MKRIRELFHGCEDVLETENGFIPLRITGKVLELYNADPVTPYAYFPASVFIEFNTDAQEISVHYEVEKTFFLPLAFDIYEDGVFMESHKEKYGWLAGDIIYHPVKKNSVIRIYLPSASKVVLSAFELGNWNPVKESGKKALFYGDSITQGLFGIYPSLGLVPTLGRILGIDYINLSVGGAFYNPEVVGGMEYDPDYVFIMLGTNDWVHNMFGDELRRNVESYYDSIDMLYAGKQIIIVTPIHLLRCMSKEDAERFESVRTIVRECAEKRDYYLVNGYQMLPANRDFFTDDVHPNDLGFQQYAANLARSIKSIL